MSQQRTAVITALLFLASGVTTILSVLGVLSGRLLPGAPVWLGVAGGLVFVLAGVAILVGYAMPGRGRFTAQVIQYVLWAAVMALLTASFAWVAFGPGERPFRGTLALPFGSSSGTTNEMAGRVVFGIATIGWAVVSVWGAIIGAKKILRRRHHSGRIGQKPF